jgi:hypothetical protein
MDHAILPKPTTRWVSANLAKSLNDIIHEDKEIRRWFNDWKSDIIDFHETVKQKTL